MLDQVGFWHVDTMSLQRWIRMAHSAYTMASATGGAKLPLVGLGQQIFAGFYLWYWQRR